MATLITLPKERGYRSHQRLRPYQQWKIGRGLQGETDFRFLLNHEKRLGPIGDVKIFVPESPDEAKNLLDACMVFVTSQFRSCPSFGESDLLLKGIERMDFGTAPERVPVIWKQFRREALPLFRQLPIFEASLTMLKLSEEHYDCGLDDE